MQGELTSCDAAAVTLGQHLVGEMKACRWRCHAAVDVAVNRLIVGEVAFLGAAVEVGGDGNLAHCLKHRCKSDVVAVPVERYLKGVASTLSAGGVDGDCVAVDNNVLRQRTALPALAVAHQAQPGAAAVGLENELVVAWGYWLKAENLYLAAGGLAESQSCVYHTRVVVDEHRVAGQQSGHLMEDMLLNGLVFVHEHHALLSM